MRLIRVLAACLLPSLAAAQPIQVLHAFPGTSAAGGAVIQVPDGSLYGMASDRIYKVDTGGAVTVAAPLASGYGPLVRGSDGALYGTTVTDGEEGRGSIVRFDPATGELRTLYTLRGASDGRDPIGGLVEVAGQLYGVTQGGPDFAGRGTIFRTDAATGATRTLYAFRDLTVPIASTPSGPLTRAADGRLYGMTLFGAGGGAIYRFDPASPDAGIAVVAVVPNGLPVGRLVAAADGRLYGSAKFSGPEMAGTIFSLDPATGLLTTLYALTPSNGVDGTGPGELTIGLDGHLYGTTMQGNAATSPAPGFIGPPTLFRLRLLAGAAVAYETLRNLDPYLEGRTEPGVLTTAANGLIYGVAGQDGPLGSGTLFRFDPLAPGPPSNPLQFTVLYAFPSAPSQPSAPVLAPDGFLYGTTNAGGTTGRGTVYRLDRSTGAMAILGTLPGDPIGTPSHSTSALVPGPDGMLYGTTASSIDPSPSPTARQNRIVRVDPATGLASPAVERLGPLSTFTRYSGLVRTAAGTIYGLRQESPTSVVFRFDPLANTTTDVATLNGGSSVALPLLAASDGQLYATVVEFTIIGVGNLITSTTLRRVNLATGAFDVVGPASSSFVASNPVQGPGGLIYYAVTNTTPIILAVNPATGDQQVACTVGASGSITTLSAAPDGVLHGILASRRPIDHVLCDPSTHAVVVETVPPSVGPIVGPLVAIDGLLYGASDRALFRMPGAAALPPLDSEGDGLPNVWETAWGLDPFDATGDDGANGDPDHDGRTNAQELADGTHPRGLDRRYFAEGATGPFFQTRIDLGNPRVTPAIVQLRFLTDRGLAVTQDLVVAERGHRVVDPATLPGLAHANFSTVIEADGPIGVDRTMSWDASGYGSHLETGIPGPSTTWYFAEGSTSDQFSLFYLLENPQATPVTATVRYLRPVGQAPVERTYVLPPASRTTISVDAQGPELASTDVSAVITATAPIVAERAMYFNRPGQPFAAGHSSAGVTAPALEWFLAEGATGDFFDLFVLLSNPNAIDASVEIEYLLAGGGTLTKTYAVPASSRVTIWVDDEQIPAGSGQRPLASAALSTRVRSLNAVPIVVERTMWWPGPAITPNFWYETHNSPGSTVTATRWQMGGGEFGGPANASTYVLIANPGTVAGTARVTLLMDDGNTRIHDYDLPAKSRTNVPISSDFFLTSASRFAIVVESLGLQPVPIVVERATYTSPGGVTWAAGGNALAAPWP